MVTLLGDFFMLNIAYTSEPGGISTSPDSIFVPFESKISLLYSILNPDRGNVVSGIESYLKTKVY